MTVQLVVNYFNGQTGYFTVPENTAWRIDTMHRIIVIGKCLDAVRIPLDNVASWGMLGIPVCHDNERS